MDIFKSIDSELALFTGAGGGLLGSRLLGFRTVGAVECEAYPRGVLMQRQNDGSLDPFPIWDDVRTFSILNEACSGYVRGLQRIAHRLIISGGFPCQDISVAGKGAGIEGSRSGMWGEYHRVVCEIRPAAVYVENSPLLTTRGIYRVLGNLAEVGYDAVWGVLGASDVGANHHRKRIWILAYTNEYADRRAPGQTTQAKRKVQQQYPMVQPQSAGELRFQAKTHATHPDLQSRTAKQKEQYQGTKKPAGSSPRKMERDAANPDKIRCSQDNFQEQAEQPEQVCRSIPNSDQFNDDGSGHGASKVSQQQSTQIWGNHTDSYYKHAQGMESGTQQGRNGRPDRLQSGEGSPRAGSYWQTEPDVGRVADGVAYRVDRLKV